jgi:uncharacterized protein (DUF2147 family)
MVMIVRLVVALGILVAASVSRAAPASPIGNWLADDARSHVAVAPCGDKLCGTVTWLKDPLSPAGQPLTDSNNPDPALRSRPIIGLQVLQGFAPDSAADQWEGGSIYDPETGKTYACTMVLQDPNTLRVHGYVGVAMFGRTQIWTRLP